MSCGSINPPCSQDSYYSKRTNSQPNYLQFYAGFSTDPNKIYKCDNSKFANNKDNNNYKYACPSGYVLDPNILKNPCAAAVQYNQYFCNANNTQCGYAYYWYLNGGCIPQDPNINSGDMALCCSTGLDCPNAPYCCPKGVCKDTSKCGDFMSNRCQTVGLSDPACSNYISTTSNQDSLKKVVQSFLNYQITNNPQTLQNQPKIQDIITMCQKAPPGTCDNILKNQCQIYSRDDIASDPNLSTLCGCFMRPSNYQLYRNLIVDKSGNLLTQCDPACMNAYALQPAQIDSSGNVLCKYGPCNSPICIIDFRDENVQKAWSSGVDLSQNCVAVGTDPSVCFIGMSKADAEQYLTKDITISQNCDKSFLWDTSSTSPNPPLIPLDTSDPAQSIANYYGIPYKGKTSVLLYIAIGIIATLVLLGVVYAITKFMSKN